MDMRLPQPRTKDDDEVIRNRVRCANSAPFYCARKGRNLRHNAERIAPNKRKYLNSKKRMVPPVGIEPTLPKGNGILNPARLPVPPQGPASESG